jgi:hypothetical protein
MSVTSNDAVVLVIVVVPITVVVLVVVAAVRCRQPRMYSTTPNVAGTLLTTTTMVTGIAMILM